MMSMAASRMRPKAQLDLHCEYLNLEKHMWDVALGELYGHRSGVGSMFSGIRYL